MTMKKAYTVVDQNGERKYWDISRLLNVPQVANPDYANHDVVLVQNDDGIDIWLVAVSNYSELLRYYEFEQPWVDVTRSIKLIKK